MAAVSAILTAAGESTRMGSLKPLLPWGAATLVEHQVRCLMEGGASEVVVVLGYQAELVAPYAERSGARHAVNPDYLQGKTTSIRAGLRSIDPEAEAILLLAVDQPRTPSLIRQVVDAHIAGRSLLTSPRYGGHGGHPLVFSASLKGELEQISEEREGIREVFQAHLREVTEVEIDDPMIRLDLNTREEYEEAKRRYRA